MTIFIKFGKICCILMEIVDYVSPVEAETNKLLDCADFIIQ